MVFAVVHDHAHVLHGEAGERTLGQNLLDAFFDRRDERVRDRAAFHLIDELESGSARKRLDFQKDLAELPRAAGLLLVPVMAFGFRRDRLAIRDARRTRFDFELELRRHSLEHRAKMQFAETSQHGLVGERIVLGDERRILGDHFVQDIGNPLFVAATLRREPHGLRLRLRDARGREHARGHRRGEPEPDHRPDERAPRKPPALDVADELPDSVFVHHFPPIP